METEHESVWRYLGDAIYVVSEENAAIDENNRFTERLKFQSAFNLPLSRLYKAYLSVKWLAWRAV